MTVAGRRRTLRALGGLAGALALGAVASRAAGREAGGELGPPHAAGVRVNNAPVQARPQPGTHARPLRPASGPAPALVLPDASGKTHDLAQLRGRVVLVNFWATWCEPCRDEMPALERLAFIMEDKPFSLLAVNVGESPQKAEPFLRSMGVKLVSLYDRFDRVAKIDWKVRMLPATWIVDAEGRLRHSLLGEAEWDRPEYVQAIERLLPAGPPRA